MRPLWLLPAAVPGLIAPAAAGEAPAKYRVVTPKDDGIIATGINGRGDVVGFEWVRRKDNPIVTDQVPFFARGAEITRLPLLEGYTATSPAAVSDDGVVAGHAGKFGKVGVRVPLRTQAFVWDAERGIRGLGVLEGDWASVACGIARDGRRVSGFSVGDDRRQPCVWDRQGDGDRWKATALPHDAPVCSSVVAISGDGRRVAAADGSTACLWTRADDGRWTREAVARDESLVPRAVNDSGTIVGLRHTRDGDSHAVAWSRAGGYAQLKEPEGYTRSEAAAVNDDGVVVGMVAGPKLGPGAFVYEGGRMRVMDEGGPAFGAATAINDRGQVAGVIEKD